MSFNGQTVIFYFLQWAKEPKIPCINLITLNLNEPFSIVPCINLINHNLNNYAASHNSVHKADNPLFQDVAHKEKNKISRKMPAEATIALINQGKVFVCVCVYKHRHSQTLHLWELHRLLESRFVVSSRETCLICFTPSTMCESLFVIRQPNKHLRWDLGFYSVRFKSRTKTRSC